MSFTFADLVEEIRHRPVEEKVEIKEILEHDLVQLNSKLSFQGYSTFPHRSFLVAFATCAFFWCGCTHNVTTSNPNLVLSLPDSVKTLLNGEAPIIGFYAAVAEDSSYLDTVLFPTWATSRAYQSLGYLWQTTGMPERDTVFDVFAIQEIGAIDFHTIILCEDSPDSYQSVLNQYQFTPDSIYAFTVYQTPLLLNTIAIASIINDSLGFDCAQPNVFGGLSTSVQAIFQQGWVLLNFTYSWGDCASGCITYREWSFKVYISGDVTFLGASGDPPPFQKQRLYSP